MSGSLSHASHRDVHTAQHILYLLTEKSMDASAGGPQICKLHLVLSCLKTNEVHRLSNRTRNLEKEKCGFNSFNILKKHLLLCSDYLF